MRTFDFTNPARWNFEGAVYLYVGSDQTVEIADELMREMAEWNGVSGRTVEFFDEKQAMSRITRGSRFDERRTCDHCGAHFNYGALYTSDEGETVVVGNICATNKLNLTAHEYADKKLRTLVKRARSVVEGNRRMAALAANRSEALNFDHYIVDDIRSKFRRYGSLSVRQWALVKKIARESAERAERLAEQKANAKPIPADVIDGRNTFTGEILATKWQATDFGDQLKMLVLEERGFKLWGTAPSKLWEDHDGSIKGMIVQFDATIEVSKDDECFGFYKRPTKVSVIKEAKS